jgi:hypothetical protein
LFSVFEGRQDACVRLLVRTATSEAERAMFGLVRTLPLASMIAGLFAALVTGVAGAERLVPGGALAGQREATFSTRGLITHLAADGNRVALMTTKIRSACDRVVVWTPPGRRSTSVKTDACPGDQGAIPSEVIELALGAGQVAWVMQQGGNTLELLVEVAKLPGGRAKLISHLHNGYGAGGDPTGDWAGRLLGGGALLVYNRWKLVCTLPPTSACDLGHPGLRITDQKLVRLVAGRGRVVARGPDSYPLSAVGGGRMAIESDGTVNVLATNGARLATVPALKDDPPKEIALSRAWLAIERESTLDLYDPVTGERAKSIPLGSAAALQLVGVSSKLAVLLGPRRFGFVRLGDGKVISRTLHPEIAASVVDARLTAAGLFYTYNVRRTPAKGRVVFERTSDLLARF